MECMDDLFDGDQFGSDASYTLLRLFRAIAPLADDLFKHTCLTCVLHQNDNVMKKAFVYGVLCLSKWLGEGHFPKGYHGQWPPELPEYMKPLRSASP